MGCNYSETIKFNCGHDHSQTESCFGHTLRLRFNRSSDTVCIEIDGKDHYTMSDGEFAGFAKVVMDNRDAINVEIADMGSRSLRPTNSGWQEP